MLAQPAPPTDGDASAALFNALRHVCPPGQVVASINVSETECLEILSDSWDYRCSGCHRAGSCSRRFHGWSGDHYIDDIRCRR